METNELKPCPFCGGYAEEFITENQVISPLVIGHPISVFTKETYFGVRCPNCDVAQTNPFISREYSVAAWNKREANDPLQSSQM